MLALRASLLVVLPLLLGGRLAADPPAGDWPQWLGPNRTNISVEAGLLTSWPEGGPALVWQAKGLGEGVASVAISAGRLYTLGYRGEDEFVTALDLDNGKVVWSTRIGPAVKEASIMRWLSQRTPTIDGGRVYAVTAAGELICLEATGGKEEWRKDYRKDFGGSRGIWGFCDHPLVDGERLICTPGGPTATIIALNKATGGLIWKSPVPEGDAAAYAGPVVAEFGGVRQFVNFLEKGIVSVAAADGKFLWRYDKVSSRTGNTLNLVILSDGIFAANGYVRSCAVVKPVRSGDAFQVQEDYRAALSIDPWLGSAIRHGEYVFLCQNGGGPQCLDLKTGKPLWVGARTLGQGRANMTCADGHLYVRFSDGKVLLLEATHEECRVKGSFTPPSAGKEMTWTMPVVTGGRLYLRDQDQLLCYDIKEKRRKTRAPDAIFVPTPQDIVEKMLALAKVEKSDVLYDLGCGDGRIVVTAAKKHGARAVGYEIDPECVKLSLENVKQGKVEHLVRIEQQDIFTLDLSKADVITLYLLPRMNEKLIPQLEKLKPGSRIVAHHFPIPGIKPDKAVELESSETGEKHTVYLWTTPLLKMDKNK